MLTYTVTVTNTGNIPLTNVVVTDSLITPTGGTTPCASVPVGGTCTLIGTYTVTAADVTTGRSPTPVPATRTRRRRMATPSSRRSSAARR